jgi:small subunit ribosomal protein S1
MVNGEEVQHAEPEMTAEEPQKGGGETQEVSTTTQSEDPSNATSDPNLAPGSVVPADQISEEAEYSEDEYDELMRLYDQTMTDFAEGEVVRGKVLAVGDKEVAVDIGFKSEGVIPIDEFPNPEEIEIGDDIEVFLDVVEDQEGQLVLSKRKADFMRVWEKIVQAYENNEVIQGTCVRRIKGGMVVDLMGIDAFLPGSQIDVRPIRDFDAYIGRSLDFKVVKINEARKNIVVSHRVLVEEQMAGQREKILANLERGQVLEGTVKNITDFGVFIDLGGVDGLLHINDLSWGRVGHPSEVVKLDEKIKVMVLDFNEAKDRISLGLKQLQPHPWEDVEEKYPVGSVVRGKVVSISDYGAFVELEKGVEGLIHISEMSWTQHIKHPSKVVSVGEIVEAKVLNVDVQERKISLGLKQLEPDPWENIEEKYPVDSRHVGKVRNLTNFGAFVELEEGIDGLVHISDLSWTKKIRHPGEVLKKGDEIEVVVLNVDKNARRISLGYKQTMENPWEVLADTYKVGTLVTGKIVRLLDRGVIVELPEGVDGFVPLSHLGRQGISKPSDAYKVGDELQLAVIEFSKDAKKIILSEKRAQKLIAEEARKAKAEGKEAETTVEAPAAEGEQDEAAVAEAVEAEVPAEAAATAVEAESEVADAPEASAQEVDVVADAPEAPADEADEAAAEAVEVAEAPEAEAAAEETEAAEVADEPAEAAVETVTPSEPEEEAEEPTAEAAPDTQQDEEAEEATASEASSEEPAAEAEAEQADEADEPAEKDDEPKA